MKFCLIGAGGHARVVADALTSCGHHIVAYADMWQANWLDAIHIRRDADLSALPDGVDLALGFGATDPAALQVRVAKLDDPAMAGRNWPKIVHPDASVASDARLDDASQVFARVRIQPDVTIGRGAIINTGAIIEHGSVIGEGAHVAPGAIVLGDCQIGANAMIGAGAVLLPGARVPAGTLVPATSRFPK